MSDLELHAIENRHGQSGDAELTNKKISGGFTGLTKEELLRIEKEDKFWRNLRIVLFILFWVIWVGLLVASVVIVILTPKCPPKPVLNGWEKSCMYRVNPFAFKDSNGDKVGDINGLKSKLDYITKSLDSQTIILDSILKGEFGDKYLHQTTDFQQIDPKLGSLDDLKSLARDIRKQGQTLIVTLDINSISIEHPWFSKPGYTITIEDTNFAWKGSYGKSSKCKHGDKYYYTSVGTLDGNDACIVVDLNYANVEVKNEIKKVIEFWLKEVNVGGILLTNVAYLVENVTETETDDKKIFTTLTNDLLKELKLVFEEVNKVNSKKKVLMVEAGDLIDGIEYNSIDKIVDFYPNADVVLVRDFVTRRGWKSLNVNNNNVEFSLRDWNSKYPQSSKDNNPIAKSIATPFHLRHDDLEAIAGVYLLPGLPIIYFGTELGMNIKNIEARLTSSTESPTNILNLPFYPKSARSIAYLNSPADNIYQKDIFLNSILPWNSQGGFSNNATEKEYDEYNKLFATPDNVQLHSATGAPANFLTLIKQLSKLRQKESILWGKLDFIEQIEDDKGYKRLVFTRSAEGHNKIIVVFMTQRTLADGSKDKGSAVSLQSQCSEARVRVTYPPNSQLPTGQVIPTEDVYIDTSHGQSLNVFECE